MSPIFWPNKSTFYNCARTYKLLLRHKLVTSGTLYSFTDSPLVSPAVQPFPSKSQLDTDFSKNRGSHMRGITSPLRANNIFDRIYPITTSWVNTVTPKKVKDDGFEKNGQVKKEEVDPIVTFSKPPPVPPLLGPLVLLSLWETWSTRDDN